eukprot:maker-scaffold_2-snap-gene-13.40-mRNA-1 protein AED:0.02 eAED:0.02 QI:114/1/1/1/0.66/0.5/4/155/661
MKKTLQDIKTKATGISKTMQKLNIKNPVPSDLEISQEVVPLPIQQVADNLGLDKKSLIPYGEYKAKVDISKMDLTQNSYKQGNYVVVTGINPTPKGEGKSTCTIGLCQALGAHLNKKVVTCIRQPSQGPTFGIKGGAAGGGYSQVTPMEEFNLHMTGDLHAITAANNLVAAAIDTRVFHEKSQSNAALFKRLFPPGKETFGSNMIKRLEKIGVDLTNKTKAGDLSEEEIAKFVRLDFDEDKITWKRVVDVCDRALRDITVGQGALENPERLKKKIKLEKPSERKTGFDITVASEIMAVLALCTSLQDMKERFGKMVVGYSKANEPINCDDLGVTGAITVLMKDAIHPTLMQTLEETPVFVHCGPFANIAHGNSSVIADQLALKLVGENGFCVTEAGFGADIGFEKFMHIKCRASGLVPHCAVIVATVRALKTHGEVSEEEANSKSKEEADMLLLERGTQNLLHHIKTIGKYGLNCVVAVNKFTFDTAEETALVVKLAKDAGAFDAVVSSHWQEGGKGAVNLAKAVTSACEHQKNKMDGISTLYTLEDSLKQKIETICTEVYGAAKVQYSDLAEEQLERYTTLGYGNLPVCMAKTHLSLSGDPKKKGAPKGFTVKVREVRASVGAGFVYPLLGEIMTIPGLPTRPGFYDIDITADGKVIGLF